MSSKIDRYDNIAVERSGTKLILTIETDEDKVDAQPSGSGKNVTIATTGGTRRLNGGLCLSLTLYRKP